MEWIRKLFGLQTPLEKKKKEHADVMNKAFIAQRNGDLSKAGEYLKIAEAPPTQVSIGGGVRGRYHHQTIQSHTAQISNLQTLSLNKPLLCSLHYL